MNLCNDVLTIFNAKYNPDTGSDEYLATVVSGISWFGEIAVTVDSSGLKSADKFIIRIPKNADFSGKTYMTPREYANTADVGMAFTLQNGDIVVHGAVAESGLSPAILHKQYEAFSILGVTDNRRAPNAPHWKVIGV